MTEREHISKAVRLLAICEWLRVGERMTARDIARRLGVSPRTAQRYIADVEEVGVPLIADRGSDFQPIYRMFHPPVDPAVVARREAAEAENDAYWRQVAKEDAEPGGSAFEGAKLIGFLDVPR